MKITIKVSINRLTRHA